MVSPMSKGYHIWTIGCQMNEADTELMFGLLRHKGYSVAEDAEQADVVLVNTCAVRERAEERVFGRLGWLKAIKAKRPEMVLGVTGCMAERMREAESKAQRDKHRAELGNRYRLKCRVFCIVPRS